MYTVAARHLGPDVEAKANVVTADRRAIRFFLCKGVIAGGGGAQRLDARILAGLSADRVTYDQACPRGP
jgi:hypothetical protein